MTEGRIFSNIERFIHEVSTRSCIWNKHCPDYKIRSKRKTAWEEICVAFFPNYNSKGNDRKEHLCRLLQRKWKSLRDTYVRDIRKNNRLRYAHSNSLSFLDDSITLTKPLESKPNDENTDFNYNMDEDYEQEDNEDENEDDSQEEMIFSNKSYIQSFDNYPYSNDSTVTLNHIESEDEKKTISALIQQTTSASSKPIKPINPIQSISSPSDEDEDRLFLLSLLTDIKKIPEQNKLQAKSELLLVINKWKNPYVNL